MFRTYRELIITIVLILSLVSNSSEISSYKGSINQTAVEGKKTQLNCKAAAMPGNVTVKWFWDGAPVEATSLETRISKKRNGSLVLNPVNSDDSGRYFCKVSNALGESQHTLIYLNVEYSARVIYTNTIQYLAFQSVGVVQCYIKANPPLQLVRWTKDKHILEPFLTDDTVILNNGSLLLTKVNENHQGLYTCTPYNAHGTQGSPATIQILVRKPPIFTVVPQATYHRKIGETVEMHCDAQAADGTINPIIRWQRADGTEITTNRIRLSGANITIEKLQRSDFGFYQCIATNEGTAIVATTHLAVEQIQPFGPYNLTAIASEFTVILTWLPEHNEESDYTQDYVVWLREASIREWLKVPVTPSGSTRVKISCLNPGTVYEFQVAEKNASGEDMKSEIITVQTLGES